MPVPRYIYTPSEFKAALAPGDIETKFRDFKQTVHDWQVPSNTPDRAKRIREAQKEVCRDIAQFANTEGGCLLIGIAEHRDKSGLKVFDKVVGVPDPEGLKDWISTSVQNLLTPKTFSHTIDPIHLPDGVVLAVNVHPSRHMVSLWDRQESMIEFPYRTSHGKAWMNPSEAEAHMMSGSRFGRIAIEKAIAKFLAAMKGVQSPLIVEMASGVFERTAQGLNQWWPGGLTIALIQPKGEDEDTFGLTIIDGVRGNPTVWVPFGAVRDCWLGNNKDGNPAIGLLLSVRLITLNSGNFVIEG